MEWKTILLEAARGSVIYRLAAKEEVMEDFVREAFIGLLKHGDNEYNRRLIDEVKHVKFDRLIDVSQKYLKNFLDLKTTSSALICNPVDMAEAVDDLRRFGFEFKIFHDWQQIFKGKMQEVSK